MDVLYSAAETWDIKCVRTQETSACGPAVADEHNSGVCEMWMTQGVIPHPTLRVLAHTCNVSRS